MLSKILVGTILCCSIFSTTFTFAGQHNIQTVLQMLDAQIENSDNQQEKARLYCFKARNYSKIDDIEEARTNYILALNTNYSGWLLNEYGYFLYKNGMYDLAYKASQKVLKEFPYLKKEATILQDKAYARYEAEYYLKNPPTIVMDTKVDPYRVTRHDLIRQHRKNNPLPAVISSPSKTRKS